MNKLLTPRTEAMLSDTEQNMIADGLTREPGYMHGFVKLCRQLEEELAEALETIRQLRQEVRDASQAAATEERWKGTQGEEYGSY